MLLRCSGLPQAARQFAVPHDILALCRLQHNWSSCTRSVAPGVVGVSSEEDAAASCSTSEPKPASETPVAVRQCDRPADRPKSSSSIGMCRGPAWEPFLNNIPNALLSRDPVRGSSVRSLAAGPLSLKTLVNSNRAFQALFPMRDSKQHKLLSINIQLEAAQQDDGDEGHLHEDDVGDEGTAAEPREGTVSLVIPVTNDEVRSFQRSLRELGLGSVTGAAGPGSSRAPWGSSRRQRRRPPVPSMRLELPFSTREGIVFGFWQRCPYG